MDPCVALSQELCLHIFSFLGPKELWNNHLVCTAWRSLSQDPWLWKCLCKRDFFMSGNVQPDNKAWSTLYEERRRQLARFKDRHLSSDYIRTDIMAIEGNLAARYKGKSGDEAFAADEPLQPLPFGDHASVAYFEMHIEHAGDVDQVMIGIGLKDFPATQAALGWVTGSYGYHGDDGHIYAQSAIGRKWGPTFTSGDIIGCGVDLQSGLLFFTKNGELLGIAARNIHRVRRFYPTVALRSAGARLRLNFGGHPFTFDVGPHALHLETLQHTQDVRASKQSEPQSPSQRDKNEPQKNESADESDTGSDSSKDDSDGEDGPVAIASSEAWSHIALLENLITTMSRKGADEDEELIEYCRSQIKALKPYFRMENLDIDNMPPDELIQMMKEFLLYAQAYQLEDNLWNLAPEVVRPDFTEQDYWLVMADLGLLKNAAHLTTAPSIQSIIAYYASSAQATPHIGQARWQAFTDNEKRKCLVLALDAICRDYEICLCRRDTAIIKKAKDERQRRETIARIRQRTAHVRIPPELQGDEQIALWTLTEIEKRAEQARQDIIEETRQLVGIKFVSEYLADAIGGIVQQRLAVSPRARTNVAFGLLGVIYTVWMWSRSWTSRPPQEEHHG